MTSQEGERRAAIVLAVGDPRRELIGRAVMGSLFVGVVFVVFAFGVKEGRAFGTHAPWAEDPYDAVVSFAIFFVPLIVGLSLLRLPLARRSEPLPAARAVGLLRAAQVILAVVLATLAADWVSAAAGADPANWSPTTTVLIALLAVVTLIAIRVVVDLARVSANERSLASGANDDPDWLADAVGVALLGSRQLGPLGSACCQVIGWIDRHVVTLVRRHPLTSAGLLAFSFGALIAASAAAEEGVAPVLLVFFGVAACAMFAFLVGAGAYLGLVRARGAPVRGMRRRLIDATVLACASVPIAVAFRDALWWAIGSSAAVAGLEHLEVLLMVVAVATFGTTFLVESATRAHDPAGSERHAA